MTLRDEDHPVEDWGWHNIDEEGDEDTCKYCGSSIRAVGDKFGGVVRCEDSGIPLADW